MAAASRCSWKRLAKLNAGLLASLLADAGPNRGELLALPGVAAAGDGTDDDAATDSGRPVLYAPCVPPSPSPWPVDAGDGSGLASNLKATEEPLGDADGDPWGSRCANGPWASGDDRSAECNGRRVCGELVPPSGPANDPLGLGDGTGGAASVELPTPAPPPPLLARTVASAVRTSSAVFDAGAAAVPPAAALLLGDDVALCCRHGRRKTARFLMG